MFCHCHIKIKWNKEKRKWKLCFYNREQTIVDWSWCFVICTVYTVHTQLTLRKLYLSYGIFVSHFIFTASVQMLFFTNQIYTLHNIINRFAATHNFTIFLSVVNHFRFVWHVCILYIFPYKLPNTIFPFVFIPFILYVCDFRKKKRFFFISNKINDN